MPAVLKDSCMSRHITLDSPRSSHVLATFSVAALEVQESLTLSKLVKMLSSLFLFIFISIDYISTLPSHSHWVPQGGLRA